VIVDLGILPHAGDRYGAAPAEWADVAELERAPLAGRELLCREFSGTGQAEEPPERGHDDE
jgi:hypothetical protein